jgi:hypothetical protein
MKKEETKKNSISEMKTYFRETPRHDFKAKQKH